MNFKATFHILGGLLVLLSGAILTPCFFSWLDGDSTWIPFLESAAVTLVIGLAIYKGLKPAADVTLSHREAFGVVTLSWLIFSLCGAIPYVFTDTTQNWVDAFFESMSGFTTTGATVLTGLDELPRSILFWRSLTQWMGGMGIIVLSLAIMPFLGVGGMQLFYAESPGPTKDRLTPRIQDTAKLLWGVYFFFTISQIVLLLFGGVGWFDALCHALTTAASGGFSTYDSSVGNFDSAYIHWVFILFMFLSGVNFSLHYRALRGKPLGYFKSDEFRFYVLILAGAISLITLMNWVTSGGLVFEQFTDAAFHVISLSTSTGYATRDYELWPVFAHFILLFLMLVGGCAGSTSGGLKVMRVLLIFKYSFNELFHLLHPKAVKPIKIDKTSVPPVVVQTIMGLAGLYFCTMVVSTLLLSTTGMDLLTAVASVIAALSNIGPGFWKRWGTF